MLLYIKINPFQRQLKQLLELIQFTAHINKNSICNSNIVCSKEMLLQTKDLLQDLFNKQV